MNSHLLGRSVAAALNPLGRKQAALLGRHLANRRLTAVHSSPRERALQTAAAIARAHALGVQHDAALDEVDFGWWSGHSFAQLQGYLDWRRWNAERAHAATPAGETVRGLQSRLFDRIAQLAALHSGGGYFAMVTHAEIIRSAVMHLLDLPTDGYARIEIRPAGITTLRVDPHSTIALEGINEVFAEERIA